MQILAETGFKLLDHAQALEYQGCAMGDIRRHDQPSDMAMEAIPLRAMQCFGLRDIRDREAQRIERHALASHFRRDAELIAKRDLFHDLDIAVFGARLDADRTRMQIAQAGKCL